MEFATFSDARRALERQETSCEALVSSFLGRIEAGNAPLNALVSVEAGAALERARALDAGHARGVLPPLAGMVVAVKDVLCRRGVPTTAGSRILDGYRPVYDATAVERLEAAGAVVVGRANCDEFAMGSSNENSAYGPARNPVNPAYVPGGSSGGSAAAVAASFCHTALGTDTGGSVRQPAAFCGVVGLKPTYGRVSRHGLIAYASSFDTVGPLGRSVADVAAVLGAIAGLDRWDGTSAPAPVPDYAAALDRPVAGLRVGLPDEYFADGLDPEIRTAIGRLVEALRAEGATVQPVHLPHTRYGIACYYVLTTAEASSNLARYDGVRYGYRADDDAVRRELAEERRVLEGALAAAPDAEAAAEVRRRLTRLDTPLGRLYARTRTEGFGEEVKRRIMLGTYVLSAGYYDAFYGRAQRVRTLIRRDFEAAFEAVDVLLTPATPTPAFRLGEKTDDPLAMYLSDVYTVTANLAGIPGLVVPVGVHSEGGGLPIGAQFLGRPFEEATLLAAGAAAMRAAGTATD